MGDFDDNSAGYGAPRDEGDASAPPPGFGAPPLPGFAPPPPPPMFGGQPTFVAYGANPVVTVGAFQSASALATMIQIFLAFDAILLIVSAIQTIQDHGRLNDVFVTTGSTIEMRQAINSSSSVGGFLSLAILGTIVVFIMWFYRSRRNAAALGDRVEYSPGMAIGAWFIPLANFVLPIQIAMGMWSPKTVPNRKSMLVPALWWATFIVGPWVVIYGIGQMAFSVLDGLFFDQNAQYWHDRWATGSAFVAVGDFILVASALLAVAFVRGVTASHDSRFKAVTSSGQIAY